MLVESLIRKTLNVKRYKVVRVAEKLDGIEVYIDRNNRCRLSCGQRGTLAKVREDASKKNCGNREFSIWLLALHGWPIHDLLGGK